MEGKEKKCAVGMEYGRPPRTFDKKGEIADLAPLTLHTLLYLIPLTPSLTPCY